MDDIETEGLIVFAIYTTNSTSCPITASVGVGGRDVVAHDQIGETAKGFPAEFA